MIAIIPIEPVSEAHGMLIVEAFNMFFIDEGGKEDGYGYDGGYGNGRGDGYGLGWDHGFGDGNGGNVPEEWQAD